MSKWMLGLWLTVGVGMAAEPVRYDAAGKLLLPEDYREWVFLSSGLGMTYGPAAGMATAKHPPFDTVFVNREAYKKFLETGKWPNKTIFILEIRESESHASINQGGHFQRDVLAVEAEVKDESDAKEPWKFYGFGSGTVKSAAALPKTAGCLACHTANAAVENTFVQFYPTLYEVAVHKGTLRKEFQPMPATTGGLIQTIAGEGWDAGRAMLAKVAATAPGAAVLEEQNLNRAGYDLLQRGKKTEAVSLMGYVAERFPTSANAQDSLGDAYLAVGNAAKAKEASEQAIRLLPGDSGMTEERKKRVEQSARERIKKIEALR